jgi:hypothetical protein
MTISLGRVTAELAEPGQEIPTDMVELINLNVKPPSKVAADDVYIRAMYVVSDQVNSFGGCFSVDEHQHLAELLVDSPVLVGHRKDQLPVGRTFHAVTVERNGHPWVKSYFYWLKSSERAEEFRANLDGGIYKECSIAFTFHLPECSICGKDIRRCQHQPFESYDRGNVSEKCHFYYRQVERLLETSLVYRGAVPDTKVVKDLSHSEVGMSDAASDIFGRAPVPLACLDDLGDSAEYLVIPHYDGLSVTASVAENCVTLSDPGGMVLNTHEELRISGPSLENPLLGVLVGQRGKERCCLEHLDDFLHDRTSPVTRLVLNLLPNQGLVTLPRMHSRSGFEVRIFPHRIVGRERLEQAVREVQTRDGVEIRPLDFSDAASCCSGYWYRSANMSHRYTSKSDISLVLDSGGNRLRFRTAGSTAGGDVKATHIFDLTDFDVRAMAAGRRFLATRVGLDMAPVSDGRMLTGRLCKVSRSGDGLLLEANGELAGRFLLRPVRLQGKDRYLFHRLAGLSAGGSR